MTLLEEAQKGLTDDIINVAKSEGVASERLKRNIAQGRTVIPKNVTHDIAAIGIGDSLRTKVNANIGTSIDYVEITEELAKAKQPLNSAQTLSWIFPRAEIWTAYEVSFCTRSSPRLAQCRYTKPVSYTHLTLPT